MHYSTAPHHTAVSCESRQRLGLGAQPLQRTLPLPALHLSISACPSQSTALNDDRSRGRSRARLHGACHAASALKQTTPFAMQHTTAHHSSAEQSLNRIHSLAQTKLCAALLWPNRKSESPSDCKVRRIHGTAQVRIALHRIASHFLPADSFPPTLCARRRSSIRRAGAWHSRAPQSA